MAFDAGGEGWCHALAVDHLAALGHCAVSFLDGGRAPGAAERRGGIRRAAAATGIAVTVLPGGLARVAAVDNTRILTLQKGGSSKDTWALSDGPVSGFSMLHSTIRVGDLIDETGTLSSRLAENLFWFGRYSERCDAIARLVRLALSRLSEGRRTERAGALGMMLHLAAGSGLVEPEVVNAPLAKAELDLFRAVLDRHADQGLAANLQRLTWCAGQAREHLSLDHWHALKRLSAEIETCRERDSDVPALLEFLDEALTTFVSLSGFAMDNMTRDMGWRLHIVGRRIERLDNVAATLARFLRRYVELDQPLHHELAVEALLELCDSIITYRTRYRAQPELLPAIHLLTMDDANPHALAFQLRMSVNYLSKFETDSEALGVTELESAFKALQTFPWVRLEAACVAHLVALLADSAHSAVMTADLGRLDARLRRRLIAMRDGYEQRFVELVAALPLPMRTDRSLWRLHLLGALNWTPTWYRPGDKTPATIGRAIVAALR